MSMKGYSWHDLAKQMIVDVDGLPFKKNIWQTSKFN
jgi:hypothetical protein